MKHGVTKFSFSKSNQAEKKVLGSVKTCFLCTLWHSVGEKELFREGIYPSILLHKCPRIYNTANWRTILTLFLCPCYRYERRNFGNTCTLSPVLETFNDPKVNVWGRILQIPWSYPLQASSVFYGLQAHQVKPGYNGACMSSILSPHIATYIQKLLLKLCKSGYCHHDCWTILENLVLWFMKTQYP